MKPKRPQNLTAALLAGALCAGLAHQACAMRVAPSDGAAYQPAPQWRCTPDSFTIAQASDTLQLQGTLDAPTPTYTATVQDADSDHPTIALTAPEGASVMVIGHLPVSMNLPAALWQRRDVTIPLKKDFNWGPDKIVCTQRGEARDQTSGEARDQKPDAPKERGAAE